MCYLAKTSLSSGLFPLLHVRLGVVELQRRGLDCTRTQFIRSVEYAGIATALALLISYPLAYWIAFRGGPLEEPVPAARDRAVLRHVPDPHARVGDDPLRQRLRRAHAAARSASSAPDGRLLATSAAVIAGITYNFLPFMVLPLYVSLEQIDQRLIEAAEDLYASQAKAFLRVTLPLSLPGVFAGVLLTFIPAAGDFINAQLLGTPRQYMIGNVIQSQFLAVRDYPTAAALSFILMAAILVMVLVFAKLLGTERLTAAA